MINKITEFYFFLYFQPESKNEKSPLQLLAQTCSQIGADNVSSKILSTTEKLKGKSGEGDKKKADAASPSINVSDAKPVSFKPYATGGDVDRAAAATATAANGLASPPKTSASSSSSPVNGGSSAGGGRRDSSSKTSTPVSSTPSGTSPVISSGLEVLAGSGKEPGGGLAKLGGLDLSNPAFRPPGLPGFPGSSMGHHHAGVCRDPYCRDPTCPTAAYNAYLARLQGALGAGAGASPAAAAAAAASGLPPGYLELLEAYKMYMPGGGGSIPPPPPHLPPTSVPSPSSASLGPGGPYICNWMNGREYCGKRYTNAEELLVHLKTHTNLSVSDSHLSSLTSAAAAAPSPAAAAAAYSSLFAAASGAGGGPASSPAAAVAAAQAAAIRGPYPSALSLAASRYSPYGKPGFPSPLPPSLSGLGMPGAPPGLPPSLGGLSPYLSSLGAASNPLSLYGLYGARM